MNPILSFLNWISFGSTSEKAFRSLAFTPVLEGFAQIIDSSVFKEVEGYPEEFHMYLDDVEPSRRVREAGYRTVCNRDTKVEHVLEPEDDSLRRMYYGVRKRFHLRRRMFPPHKYMVYLLLTLTVYYPKMFLELAARGEFGKIPPALRGIAAGLVGKTGASRIYR